jgi:hypothetical protein
MASFTLGEKRNGYRILLGKSERVYFEDIDISLEDNIKMGLK